MERLTDFVYIARFGEALRIATDKLDCKNFYAFNPNYDTRQAMKNKSRSHR